MINPYWYLKLYLPSSLKPLPSGLDPEYVNMELYIFSVLLLYEKYLG